MLFGKVISDKVIKKVFIFFLKKGREEKFIFLRSKQFFEGIVIELLKFKILNIGKIKSFEGEIVIIDDDNNKGDKKIF